MPSSLQACPICQHSETEPVLTRGGFDLVRCRQCSAVFVSPMPSAEALQAHYQNPDYFAGDESQGYRNYADMRKALLPHFQRRIRTIDAHFPTRGRLLDYGCAAGYFLEVARAENWRIAGVELSESMARQAEQTLGVPIAASLAMLAEQDFDVITLWEVVEHLPGPVAELRHLFERLRPGGLLMLSTPNTDHWQAVRDPDAWGSYRPPSHLLYFTSATLAEALRRAGFEGISVQRVSPLPPLPGWVRNLSAPLQRGLASGRSTAWPLALWTWRAIRVGGWAWQRIADPQDDIFTTLEALAFRPA